MKNKATILQGSNNEFIMNIKKEDILNAFFHDINNEFTSFSKPYFFKNSMIATSNISL